MALKVKHKSGLDKFSVAREDALARSRARRPDLAQAEENPGTEFCLAVNIHRIRKEKKWTQEMLAKRAGVSLRTVHGLESAAVDSSPNIHTVDLLANALGVKFKDLIAEVKEKEIFI